MLFYRYFCSSAGSFAFAGSSHLQVVVLIYMEFHYTGSCAILLLVMFFYMYLCSSTGSCIILQLVVLFLRYYSTSSCTTKANNILI